MQQQPSLLLASTNTAISYATYNSIVSFYVLIEVPLALIVCQQSSVVQGEVSLVEMTLRFVLLVHMSYDQRMTRGHRLEGLGGAPFCSSFAHWPGTLFAGANTGSL